MIDELNDWINQHSLLRPIKSYCADKFHTAYYQKINRAEKKAVYRVLGMWRTGNHAVINWMQSQFAGASSFCNDLGAQTPPSKAVVKRIKFGSFKKPNLIISYEEKEPVDIIGVDLHPEIQKVSELYEILIVRDPFNLFASRFAWKMPQGDAFRSEQQVRLQAVDLWKANAKAYLERDVHCDASHLVGVNFNRWAESVKYRQSIAARMGLVFDDSGRDEIKNFGSGSSFEGVRRRRKAAQMRVSTRWVQFRSDNTYRSIFMDRELCELSNEIFGLIEGTECLRG